MYSTLLTLAIKACAVVNSSLFSSKYFYFYNVKVVAKASSNFPQYHMILTCLALCKPLIPLVSHISALFFNSTKCLLTLFKIVFFPPSHPPFVLSNRYGCGLSCKCLRYTISLYSILVRLFYRIVCYIILLIMLPPFILILILQDGTTHHLTYSPSRRAPLFWSTLCYTLM